MALGGELINGEMVESAAQALDTESEEVTKTKRRQ